MSTHVHVMDFPEYVISLTIVSVTVLSSIEWLSIYTVHLVYIRCKPMAEVMAETNVPKEKGYLYYLGKDGNVWRTKMARGGKKTGGGPEMVEKANVTREADYLYYIDKGGNVARSPMARGRK